jgi:outer membrane lipoprotein SlyB
MEKRNGMLYPMMVIAAISVVLFSIVGIATMTGYMPNALSQKSDVSVDAPAAKDDELSKGDADKAAKQGESVKSRSTRALTANAAVEQRSNQGVPRAVGRCASCGVVESIQVRDIKGQGTGLGVVGGAVVGGVLGHQVGSGRGNDLATVAGAVGGGYVGNEIEKNVKKTREYVIRVRMEDESYRTITQSADPSVEAGDRVRIENGALIAHG